MTETRAISIAGMAHLLLFAVLSLSWSLMADDLPLIMDEPIEVEFVDVADVPAITTPPEPSLAAAPRELVETPIEMDPLEDVQPAELPDLAQPAETPPPPEQRREEKPKPAPPKPQELTQTVDRELEIAERAREEDDFADLITKDLPVKAQLSPIQQNTLVGLIRQRIYPCFNLNIGSAEANSVVTTLRVRAAPDGTIIGQPTVVRQTGSAPASFKRVARDAAIRAVLNPRCTLQGLPEDLYSGGWEDFQLNFDPKEIR